MQSGIGQTIFLEERVEAAKRPFVGQFDAGHVERDGVYLLPDSAASRRMFDQQASEVKAGGGTAHIFSFVSDSIGQQRILAALFDRAAEYMSTNARVDAFKRHVSKRSEPEARRQLASLRRDVAALTATDFFPGKARAQIEEALASAEAEINAHLSTDEPYAAHRKIARRANKDYRARLWATREHLWIDLVCSAWLIRRFVDPKARFRWLKRIKDCPKRAVGFDFDGAEFSHVDSRVTFEVLIVSFGLEKHAGLSRLAAMVHYLDVGGIPVGEAAGFSAIMAGSRATQQSDDALLRTIFPVLDCLHASYSTSGQLGS
ncbi:MAG TPA: chromate resistance protein ChrB domain-containing protein [Steroidobacteraceae bacterium]|nr:chromate resistance protein ChrB domain-containing protein [Steroidobacteraceae bacterium]